MVLPTLVVPAVDRHSALGLLVTLAVAVAGGVATGLDSVVVVLAALPLIHVMALMGFRSPAATRYCVT